MKKIKIKPPYIELDALLKFANLTESGGAAKVIIQGGQVKVNGEVCTQRKKKIKSGDTVSFEDNELTVCE